jgi:hypothetical protein
MLSVIMLCRVLFIIMLNVVMLSGIMLSVVAPCGAAHCTPFTMQPLTLHRGCLYITMQHFDVVYTNSGNAFVNINMNAATKTSKWIMKQCVFTIS